MEVRLSHLIQNPEVETLLSKVHDYLKTMGAITHDRQHSLHVARLSAHILQTLGHSPSEVNLAAIAGYLHDIGNVVNRYQHGISGALLAFHLLAGMGMPPEEVAVIISAIGNHEESSGNVVNSVSAAVILADKSNVHRSRVRKEDFSQFTIRDRVNYAVTTSNLEVDPDRREIVMNLTIDTEIVPVMDYFEIFLTKMLLCRRAANYLKCRFGLLINDYRLL